MKLVYVYIILLSFIASEEKHRCNLIESVRVDRPDMDMSFLSLSGNFMVHYDTLGVKAPDDVVVGGYSEYINQVAIAAENARYILVNTLGYHEEPQDDDGVYDIYIWNYNSGYYGVNVHEGNGVSYIKIDNNYEEGFYTLGLTVMKLTVAHEYFHAIQRSYKEVSGEDGYFFELASTWIEDIIVPDGDDYLYWVDDLFNYPEKDFDSFTSQTGYSLALYGHYLSAEIEKTSNPLNNTIMRDIWEEIGDGNSAFSSIKNVLENKYNVSFSDTWSDFMARNFYNGIYDDMNNDIYYHIDQANPILNEYPMYVEYLDISNADLDLNFELNDRSVDIHSLDTDAGISISLDHEEFPSSGSIAIIRNNHLNNQLFTIPVNMDIVLDPGDVVHFLYANSNGEGEIDLEISLNYSIHNTNIINIFPNPITSPGYEIVSFTVDYLKEYDNVNYQIIDLKGRIIKTIDLGRRTNGRYIEDLGYSLSAQIPSGVYFLKLDTNNKNDVKIFTIYK